MNKVILDEIINKCNDKSFDKDYCNFIDLFYEFNINLPKANQYYSNGFDKTNLINLLYNKVLDYSNQSFYNLILGNYELYRSGIRMIVENYIILKGITLGSNDEWKLYYLQSGSSTIETFKLNPKINIAMVETSFEQFKVENKLSNLEYVSKKFDYSWLSTDKRKIKTFKDACDMLEPLVYDDFKFLSYSSHSNSLYSKIGKNDYSFYNTAILHFLYLRKIIDLLNFESSYSYHKLQTKLLKCFEYLNKNNPYFVNE